MRVAVLFDGKNFYAGWRASDRPRVNFPALARWLVARVSGDSLWGAHYYTGIETGDAAETQAQESLRSYLEMLDLQPGFFVHRFGRKPSMYTCPSCGAPVRGSHEKEVDTSLVADAIRLAAIDAYDVLVLVSGDGDHAPAVRGVRALGKQAYVATWGRASLSKTLRLSAFDHVDLLDGLEEFADFAEEPNGSLPRAWVEEEEEEGDYEFENDVPTGEEMLDIFVEEVRRAEAKFQSGYVGVHYFLTRWKSDRLDFSADARRRVLDIAVEQDVVEIYDAEDGAKALRAPAAE